MLGRAGAAAASFVVLAAVLVGSAVPAGADPARPTDYRSTVLRAHPRLPDGVDARVVGGDAFLELRVARGHRVVVPDYAGEGVPGPYLRFRADGTVERNRNAVATAANRSRYGTAQRTPDPTAAPSWERVATDGRYAWHDHRIHWMAPRPPHRLRPSGRVDLGGVGGTWEVALVVDGRPTTLVGELVRLPRPRPAGLVALALGTGAGVLVLVATRARGTRLVGGAASVVAIGAVATAWATWSSAPPGAGAGPAGLVITGVGLAAALTAVAGPDRLRLASWAATAASLLGWSLLRIAVLTHAVLPTTAPWWADRAATAAALGGGAAVALALVWRPPQQHPTTPNPTTTNPAELGGGSPPLGG